MSKNSKKIESLTDEELVKEVQSGENEDIAVNILVERYIPVIRIKAASMIRYCPSADYDDLYSDGMLGLIKAMRGYKEDKGAKFVSFANFCIKNAMRTTMRAAIKNSPLNKQEDFDFDTLEDNAATAEQSYIKKEEDREFYSMLASLLTKKEYQVLSMYLRRMTYQQIASELSVSEKAVDNALQRAKAKLKAHITK